MGQLKRLWRWLLVDSFGRGHLKDRVFGLLAERTALLRDHHVLLAALANAQARENAADAAGADMVMQIRDLERELAETNAVLRRANRANRAMAEKLYGAEEVTQVSPASGSGGFIN